MVLHLRVWKCTVPQCGLLWKTNCMFCLWKTNHLWKTNCMYGVFICGNKLYVFTTITVSFSPKLCRWNWALLCNSSLLCLLWMQKIRNYEFKYFEKVKGYLPARSHTISLSKGFLNASLQRVQNTWLIGTVSKFSDTNVVFQSRFFDSGHKKWQKVTRY